MVNLDTVVRLGFIDSIPRDFNVVPTHIDGMVGFVRSPWNERRNVMYGVPVDDDAVAASSERSRWAPTVRTGDFITDHSIMWSKNGASTHPTPRKGEARDDVIAVGMIANRKVRPSSAPQPHRSARSCHECVELAGRSCLSATPNGQR